MKYICDAPHGTWFQFETEVEAAQESALMDHAVEKYFRRARKSAIASYVPPPELARIEQSIGLKGHVARAMPLFMTLRDNEGKPLATAMLPPSAKARSAIVSIVVGAGNSDPYPEYEESIKALGRHFGLSLEAEDCFPYRR